MTINFKPFRYVPPTWTYECDEDLVHYFYDHIGKEDENLGSVKQCVTSIDVSSCSVSHKYKSQCYVTQREREGKKEKRRELQ